MKEDAMRITAALIVGISMASLAQAETFNGVVFREDGEPAAGAVVGAAAVFHSPPRRISTRANERGVFRLDLPPMQNSARYLLAVRWQSQGSEVWDAIGDDGKAVAIQGRKLPLQVIRLRSAGRLRGKVLEAETGAPVPAARLFFDTGELISTNEQGGFEIVGLAMKDHSVIPVAAGRLRPYVLFDTTNQPEAELELRLPKGAIVRGRVMDEAGQPVKDAYLHRASSGTALTLNGWDELCKADGTFEYSGLSPQRLFYGLTVTAPGYESQAVKGEIKTTDDVITHDVRLKKAQVTAPSEKPEASAIAEQPAAVELPRRKITGTVHGDGQTIRGASVRWARSIWDDSVRPTTSGDSGDFALDRVPDGKGAVLVIAAGFAPQFATVGEGDGKIDVALSKGSTVRGVVRSSSGKPVVGARVVPLTHCLDTGICNPIWFDERAKKTDERGEFELVALPSVGILFDVLKQGFSDQRNLALKHDGSLNEVVLSAGGAVSGLVIDEQKKPVRNFKIRIMIPRNLAKGEKAGGYYAGFDWYGITFTRDDGTFVFTGVPANAWMRLIVSSPGVGCGIVDRAQSEPLDALPDPKKLTIQLDPFRPLTVQVRESASGKPIADSAVGLIEDGLFEKGGFNWGYHGLWNSRACSDRDGLADFKEPACEDGTVIVSGPGFARQRIAWTDHSPCIAVSLVADARLEGVIRLDGKPVREGYASLRSATNDSYSVNLRETSGMFMFDRLPAGDYDLNISGANGKSLNQTKLMLTSGATVKKEIDL
jgi:hypothetical protein